MSINPLPHNPHPFESQASFLLGIHNLSKIDVQFDGGIVKKSFLGRIVYALGWRKRETDERVAAAVINLVRDGIQYSQYLSTNFTDTVASSVKRLFLEIVPQIRFDSQKEEARILITKKVENFLRPEIQRLRTEKLHRPALKTDADHLLKRKWEKAQLAVELGLGMKANKGANGTLIIRAVNGKPVGIFKQDLRHVSLLIKIKNLFKRVFFGQLYYLKDDPLVLAKGEVASSKADRHFEFNLAPPAEMQTLNGREGAFQVYVNDYVEAGSMLKDLTGRAQFSDQEYELFQKMAIEDFLTGQLDRHEENWFIKKGPCQSMQIKIIDNANSFLKKNPPNSWAKTILKNQYKWHSLAIAKHAFLHKTKKFIFSHLQDADIDAYIQKLKIDSRLADFLDTDMERLLRERARVLVKLAGQEGMSPADLIQYRTDTEIQNFLNS